MNTKFETNFTILAANANDEYPLIFGGHFASQMDLCAAQTARRFLHESECDNAVTHKMEIEFAKPCYVGDLVYLSGEIVSTGKKSIVIQVRAERERRGIPGRDFVALARFVFVSVKDMNDLGDRPEYLPYHPHGLIFEVGDFDIS